MQHVYQVHGFSNSSIINHRGMMAREKVFLSFIIVFIFYYLRSSIESICVLLRTNLIFSVGNDPYVLETSSKSHIILFWTKFFDTPFVQNDINLDNSCLKKSPCLFTNDRALLNISSAVVFHMRDFCNFDLPPKKYNGQKFIFFTMETPEMTYIKLKGFPDKYFDMTMTYRNDSTVFCPYGRLEKKKKQNIVTDINNGTKTKMVAWIVSNCRTDSRREFYVNELKKYINVDVYGACGNLECTLNEKNEHDCEKMLQQYNFYLSLENAVCEDYITEKFFTRLKHSMVPIVLKRSIHERWAPPDSFIALDDFESPHDLAIYLKRVASDDKLLHRHLAWRIKYHAVINTNYECYCRLCQVLTDGVVHDKKEILHVDRWWQEDGACLHNYGYGLL